MPNAQSVIQFAHNEDQFILRLFQLHLRIFFVIRSPVFCCVIIYVPPPAALSMEPLPQFHVLGIIIGEKLLPCKGSSQ